VGRRAAGEGRPRVVVAGYGNPLRGDDAAGWLVAQALEARWLPPAGEGRGAGTVWRAAAGAPIGPAGSHGHSTVSVLSAQQPVPEWAPLLAEANVAYFVDACPAAAPGEARRAATAAAPGEATLQVRPVQPLTAAEPADQAALPADLLGGHALGPEGLLALARALYGSAPDAYLVAIPAEQFGFVEGLSTRTAAAVEEAIALLDGLIRAHQGDGPPADFPADQEEVLACV
jgi:Ni,Fe-hydrogenase maturation factor